MSGVTFWIVVLGFIDVAFPWILMAAMAGCGFLIGRATKS